MWFCVNLSTMELFLMSSGTLCPHIDLLQRSVLKVDFLQINFFLGPPLLLLEMRSLVEWC